MTGPLIASNTATLGLAGGSSSPGTPTTVTTVDGATVTFTSLAEGEVWGGQFIGSATTTNLFTQNVSIGGVSTRYFKLPGDSSNRSRVSGNLRFFNGGGVSGGNNTTFEIITGNVHTRDAQSVSLGYIRGSNSAARIAGNGTAGTISTPG